jgi:hypothetical protein
MDWYGPPKAWNPGAPQHTATTAPPPPHPSSPLHFGSSWVHRHDPGETHEHSEQVWATVRDARTSMGWGHFQPLNPGALLSHFPIRIILIPLMTLTLTLIQPDPDFRLT